jgi:hypothetical protein
MDTTKLAEEAFEVFSNGNIDSLPRQKLIEYIQALSCVNSNNIDERLKRSTQVQSLNTIYNIKVMEALDKKNTILTRIVMALAGLSLAATVTQLCICLF